jgi:hypothetical protein
MNRHISLGLAMLAGVAIGAAAVQGLHAQAKPKAYTVVESVTVDGAAQAAYTPLIVLRSRLPAVATSTLRAARL